jgi:hypothetical protein
MARSSDFQENWAMNIERLTEGSKLYKYTHWLPHPHTYTHTHIHTYTYTQRPRYTHTLWLLDTVTSNGMKKTMKNLNRSVHYHLLLYKETHVLKERVFCVRNMSDIAGIFPLAAVLNSVSSLLLDKRYNTAVHNSNRFQCEWQFHYSRIWLTLLNECRLIHYTGPPFWTIS